MKRLIVVLVASLLVAGAVYATGGKEAAQGAAYTVWVGEGSWLTNIMDLSFQDPVAKEITKRTGVKLVPTAARTENPEEELNVMLAADELPDMVSISGSITTKLITGNYVIPVDELIEKHAPNLKKNLGHVFNYWRYEDGRIYRVRGWVWNDPRYSLSGDVNTLYMRYDILKEMGYPKLDRSVPKNSVITVAEYRALLDNVRRRYPQMVPVMLDGPSAFNVLLLSTGIDHAWGAAIWQGGKAKSWYSNSDAAWAIRELNALYTGGYVEKGFATMSKEQAQAITASGKVFSSLGRFEGLPEARSSLSQGNDEQRLSMFYLVKDASVPHVSVNGYYIDGDNSLFITRKAKDPVGIMKFFDWCASDEGSLLLNAGVQGLSWNLVDGKRTPTDKARKAYYEWDSNLLKELGLGAWNGLLPCLAGMDKDGNANDILQQATFTANRWGQYDHADWRFYASPAYASEKVAYIDSEKQKAAYEAQSKINAYVSDRIVKAIVAPNASAADREWTATVEMMKADGLDALDAAFADNWAKAAAFFKKAPAELMKDTAVLGVK